MQRELAEERANGEKLKKLIKFDHKRMKSKQAKLEDSLRAAKKDTGDKVWA
jgi:hypothetical protein